MIVKPKVRDFICTTAHPSGCFENVKKQVDYTKKSKEISGYKNVLIIGSSTGYGLASRIALAFGYGASTLGVMFEKPPTDRRTATPGWYNNRAFEKLAKEEGLFAKTLNVDAFSKEAKETVRDIVASDIGKLDLVVYSLAAPRRTVGETTYNSVLKTVGNEFTSKNLNLRTNEINQATIPVATGAEVVDTIKVMGGEDWYDWMKMLKKADLLADNCISMAYSYVGPELTFPVYYNGTIGMAKKHLAETADKLTEEGIPSYISINKALVTQASAAIPVVPLYTAILYKVMKEKGLHEDCIMQMNRLFRQKAGVHGVETDEDGRIRLDDWEMRKDVQEEVMKIWKNIETETVKKYADVEGFWHDFYNMFGFDIDGVDYDKDVDIL